VNVVVDRELSVVVPVGKLYGDISSLESWIPSHPSVQIVLILDQIDSKTKAAIDGSTLLQNAPLVELYSVDFGNPGQTRNFGFEKTTSPWVLFSDSDDVPNISNILQAIKSHDDINTDIIVGNYEVFDINKNRTKRIEGRSLNQVLNHLPRGLGLWRFIFRRDYLKFKAAVFPHLSMAEDQIFFLSLNASPTEIKFVNQIFYRYFTGNQFQLTNSSSRIQDLQSAIKLSLTILNRSSSKVDFDFLAAQIFSLMLNSSKKYLMSNSLFLLRMPALVVTKFGFRGFLRICTYPFRRFR
jgi:glycosyltransferase involved in cell wall biosynthesis